MRKRIYEYDCIRFIAILAVVIGHSCYTSIGYTVYPTPPNISPLNSNQIFDLLRWLSTFVYTFHMPLFFILSGAVFGLTVFDNGVKKKLDLTQVIDKKIRRLILPYCFYGILFMIPIKFLMGWYLPDSRFESEIFYYLVYGTNPGHLWFLFSLFCIFVLASYFVLYFKLDNGYSILSMLIVGILLSLALSENTSTFPHSFEISIIFSRFYLISFLLGLIFAYYLPQINKTISGKWALLLSLFFFSLHIISYNILSDYPFKDVFGLYYSLLVFLELYFLCNYFCNFSTMRSFLDGRFSSFFFSNLMGIYLLHDPLNYVILKISSVYHWLENPLGVCFFYFSRTIGLFIFCALLSQFITYCLKKGKVLLVFVSKINR